MYALPEEQAPRLARKILRGTLVNAVVGESDVDDAELVVGELAANAISHSAGPYELRFVTIDGHPAWCEVVDGGRDLAGIPQILESLHRNAMPEEQAHQDDLQQESGRGLAIVHRLTGGRCRAYPTVISATGQPGKAVAFALPSGIRLWCFSDPSSATARAALENLAAGLRARGWEVALVFAEETVLTTLPPDSRTEAVKIVVRFGGDGFFFAYARSPHRQIAPLSQIDRAIRAVVLVHGGPVPPPPIPDGVKTLAGSQDHETR
ncbi:ATP-binding protein [Actinomadura fibrosa]|uniref:ATP-binding protein n=1 Tax=Actinomadura fibrosa TaxID=111802 RepID=UPI00366F82F8